MAMIIPKINVMSSFPAIRKSFPAIRKVFFAARSRNKDKRPAAILRNSCTLWEAELKGD